MDFLKFRHDIKSKGKHVTISPDFVVGNNEDLLVKGGVFYAVWDEERGLWSKKQVDAIRMIDRELDKERARYEEAHPEVEEISVNRMSSSRSGSMDAWNKYIKQHTVADDVIFLDRSLTFSNDNPKKEDHVSIVLPYPLTDDDYCPAWNELIGTLYSIDERKKLEWAIGSIVSGDSKTNQKFVVLTGPPGKGKSTVLKIIEKLFPGYITAFSARRLGAKSDNFSLEPFKDNPLIAMEHDGDLSRIEDNTILNSLVSHERQAVDTKYGKIFNASFDTMLFVCSNSPVKITDGKSGLTRRLIDIEPSGDTVSINRYEELMEQIKFELGGIARHCLNVYNDNKHMLDNYKPIRMMSKTNGVYNFIEENYDVFISDEEGIPLARAYEMYKQYCIDSNIFPKSKNLFRQDFETYFEECLNQKRIDGVKKKNVFVGFKSEMFDYTFDSTQKAEEASFEGSWLDFKEQESLIDSVYSECAAQYATEKGTPTQKWDNVTTKLKDLDTKKLHYILFGDEQANHVIIDFDIKDSKGNKSFKLNYEEARKWPETYAELSKSGEGIHLHYIYDGDVSKLKSIVKEDVEVKVFTGKSALRRKLSKCNDIKIETINSGLPFKKGETVIKSETIKSEKGLRSRVEKCLRKEHHGATAPEVSFIVKILDDAYASGLHYDISDMEPRILAFASNSTHQPEACLKLVKKMKFQSEDILKNAESDVEAPLVFFDVEVLPNFFGIVWMMDGGTPVKMMNPTPAEVEELLRYRLVGFNNRRYDNHILYARILGYSNERLYELSRGIIFGKGNGIVKQGFANAYNLSYTDIYDFSSKKQSLKKWEIELGIHHQELGIPWDEPVPEDRWAEVMDYCANDVVATAAVFHSLKQDFIAREILADITGLSVNDTTNACTTKLIVGNDKNPWDKFVYTDLSEMFPGYTFENGKSTYRGEVIGEGGYVYAEPGVYENVALLDIQSMHPNSAINLNIFGPYTKNFEELVRARIFIKHGQYDEAKKLFDGKLAPYLDDPAQAKTLAYALKIAINSVYGLTAAKFDNKLRDPRNIDNIVAKRGALFMVDLKHAVQEKGYTVAHIKTDSIKIPNADKEIIDFVMEFGKKYGYIFEHEDTYEKMCLVNDAVYIAKSTTEKEHDGWTATGKQFKVPYVFKTLFSKEAIEFEDMCETKSVTSALYLDNNEKLPEGEHDYRFVGKVGLFCPIKPGCGGAELLREKDGKYYSATGCKGYRWMEADTVKLMNKEEFIDISYYEAMVADAKKAIEEFVNYEEFIA